MRQPTPRSSGSSARAIRSCASTGADRYALGAEFYRWEFATAVAGAVLGVNPFDQPDVEAAKIVTRRLAAEYEQTGTLADDEPPLLEHGHQGAARSAARRRLLRDARVHRDEPARTGTRSKRFARLVRDRRKVATTVGFGPRYLHSTGQAHKGGPNSGVFLVITCDDAEDLPVPGQRYSFGTIKRLQARGDFEVLASRGRRVLRVHLKDVETGLRDLHAIVQNPRNADEPASTGPRPSSNPRESAACAADRLRSAAAPRA